MASRVVRILVAVAVAWLAPACDAAAANPGVPVPASRGTCVSYEGSLCAGRIPHQVYFVPDSERTMEFMEDAVSESVALTAQFGTADCRTVALDFACAILFPECELVDVGGTEIALPRSVCRSECVSWWQTCSGVLEAAIAYGQGDALASCGAEGFGTGAADTYGVKMAQDRQKAFPDGLQNEHFFPEVFNTWTSPEDASVQVQLACVTVTLNDGNASAAVDVAIQCSEGLTMPYDLGTGVGERCQFLCPHPLFGKSEYSLMRLLYVVPGLVGGGLCVFLLLDTLRTTLSKSKAAKEQRKEAMYQFQAIVGFCGAAFLVTGPASVAIGGDIGCNGLPVIPGVFDAAYVPEESVMCVLNRASIFFLLALFNSSFVHMLTTHGLLQRAMRMHVARDKKGERRRTRRLLFVALAVPAGLCAAMYAMDDLDQTSADYQAQLARWSLMCGPRLTAPQEAHLIFGPFTLTGFFVTLQSFRSWRLMRTMISNNALGSSGGSASNASASNPLQALNQKVTLLGLLCAVSLILYVVAMSQLVPALANSSNQILDWAICVSTDRDNPLLALKTVGSCGELFAITGDRSLDIEDATLERPSPELIAVTLFAETLTVCIFGAFYTSFVIKRNKKANKVFASSKKKRKETQVGIAAAKPGAKSSSKSSSIITN